MLTQCLGACRLRLEAFLNLDTGKRRRKNSLPGSEHIVAGWGFGLDESAARYVEHQSSFS